MKNIFVSNIDGTLTGLCNPFFILASGRPFQGIINMYSPKDLIIDYIVALNGAHIFYIKRRHLKFIPYHKMS